MQATLSRIPKAEINMDLCQKLRNSILAKTSSKQDSQAENFVKSANLSSYQSPVPGDNAAARAFVSKTVGFLENSMKAREALRVASDNAVGVDLSPGSTHSSESNTNSNSNSSDSKLADYNGRTVEPVSGGGAATLDHHSPGDEATKHNYPVTLDPVKEESGSPVPPTLADHGWDPEALRMVSGSDNCTVVKHGLKLFSVYPEVQGQAGTRDSKGEPCITMLHNEFKGTVDYIWRSEGLKTMKVLDTFSMNDMLVAPTTPFMVSGSDHVSLACELGFCTSQSTALTNAET
ncbi:hypothetical protein GOP47_0001198 [Adiantum capillus-veneris]|nr:hypothetical protein GOP47_0001198 [Adiantum capillus-veneris]